MGPDGQYIKVQANTSKSAGGGGGVVTMNGKSTTESMWKIGPNGEKIKISSSSYRGDANSKSSPVVTTTS